MGPHPRVSMCRAESPIDDAAPILTVVSALRHISTFVTPGQLEYARATSQKITAGGDNACHHNRPAG
jgi:hypothetical protein